jgi:Ran GTPase-activating protein (RanGAP) involved in mRNA processing and transport
LLPTYLVLYIIAQVLGLSILDLSGNPIGDGGLAALVQLIHALRPSLLTLLLPRCSISAWGLSRPGAAYSLRLVTELDLSGNPLGDEGMEQLCFHVLEAGDTPTLTVLRLCTANVGASGFNHLLTGLLVNTSLQQLYLSHNFIGGFDPPKFDRFQSVNKALKLLDLRYNRLTAPWVAHIRMSLSVGTRRLLLL